MSEEAPRPAPGHPPDQRHSRGAPAWWAALTRTDLPHDRIEEPGAAGSRQRGRDPRRGAIDAAPVGRFQRLRGRWRSLLTVALVVVLAGLVSAVGVGATSMRGAVAGLLIFGVPSLLAALVVVAIARLGR
ncbi:MAG: hypothetical protein E6J14_04445 [Chloroflexi bacterium]|nr:MAG: hypothetical protein E6J14_04445 [Chloroflexota bacterium]